METPSEQLTARLQQSIKASMVARDRERTALLRALLGAVQNAEALPAAGGPPASETIASETIAGAVVGLGAGEASRRVLSSADLDGVLAEELAERIAAAEQYRSLGRDEDAARMDRDAAVIAELRV